MARPRRKPELTDAPVLVRMTPQEKADAKAKASAAGMTLSDYVRTAIDNYTQQGDT